MSETCPVCGAVALEVTTETEVLEQYSDGVGKPNDPRRWSAGPERRMVPGATTTTYLPCGHIVRA